MPETFRAGSSGDLIERKLPHDLDAEVAVLGGMTLSKAAIAEVIEILKGHEFYRPSHETIFRAIHDLYGQGTEVDPIVLSRTLDQRGELSKIGGSSYLHTLVQSVPTAANAAYYAEIIKQKHEDRRLIAEGTRLIEMGYSASVSTAEAVAATTTTLQSLVTGTPEAVKLSVADRWESFIDQLEAGADPNAVSSPWHDLDEVLTVSGPMFITIGATTGGGKTLMMLNWGAHVALRLGRPVLVASMEMGGKEIVARLTAAEALIPLDRLTKRKLEEGDWDKLAKVSKRMENAKNFVLDDTPGLTLSRLRARIRTMIAQGNAPALILVDYLQLLTPDVPSSVRAQEVAALSRGLKVIAMEFDTPVIALSQFNRGAVGRRPLLSDFKESSAIEQDSNAVLLLHEERDEDDQPVKPGEIELIVAKNRQGAAGRVIPLAVRKHYMRLDSMALA
ncbi:replicative DNA helicase [Streptomyces sp. NPDC097619]|uniref:replicative DNA helicase n=1 Tax=Streptomyces sp. NPDC097619 TaxID=3157228 RepID=UPI00331E3750